MRHFGRGHPRSRSRNLWLPGPQVFPRLGVGGAGVYNPEWANVEYLHSNAADINDESDNSWSQFFGSTSIGTPQAVGQNTRLFPADTSSSRIVVNGSTAKQHFFLDSGDFVFETWAWADAADSLGDLAAVYYATGNDRHWRVIVRGDLTVDFAVFEDRTSSTKVTAASSAALPDQQFAHLAIQRKGDDHVIFVDGVPGTVNTTTARPDGTTGSNATFCFGCRGGNTDGNRTGFRRMRLGETRITLGEAFYPMEGFTPPSAPFPRS